MQRIIRKKLYDTETAALIATAAHSFTATPPDMRSAFIRRRKRYFFLYGIGGAESPIRNRRSNASQGQCREVETGQSFVRKPAEGQAVVAMDK